MHKGSAPTGVLQALGYNCISSCLIFFGSVITGLQVHILSLLKYGRMSSNYSSAQKSEQDFFLLRQAPEKVDFMVKDKTAVTKFKSAMTPGSHPNEKEKKPHISVIHARFQDD